MNRIELIVIALSLVLLTTFFGIVYEAQQTRVKLPQCVPAGTTFSEGKLIKLSDTEYQLFCVGRMWSFDPGRIELPVGAKLDIYLTSADVVHGFQIGGKNINMMGIHGTVNKQSVDFKVAGTYPIICHEYCGLGHSYMRGEIVVK
jgi:cytochrome c oxidase subunit 2